MQRDSLPPPSIKSFELSLDLTIRPLRSDDFNHSFLRLLNQLTDVGNIDEEKFQARVSEVEKDPFQRMLVVIDARSKMILGTGSIIVEPKFIHEAGLVGHVEDVVVEETMRGKGMGRRIVEQLMSIARETGCYKCILDCAEKNVPFYERCGFKRKEIMMVHYFDAALAKANPSGIASFTRQSADGMCVRTLEPSDYNGGFLSLLGQLTTTGEIKEEFFLQRLKKIEGTQRQHILVIEDEASHKIIGTVTVLIERKFIHEGGFAAHIEDVVTDSSVRGKGLGKKIILAAIDLAAACGCYKIILDCEEHNVAFYEKCGFTAKEVEMACYFDRD